MDKKNKKKQQQQKKKNQKVAEKEKESEKEENYKEEEEEEVEEEEEEEEEEEDQKSNISGLINDDDEDSGSEINERNLHLDETIFKKKDNEKNKQKGKKGESENEKNEDEKESSKKEEKRKKHHHKHKHKRIKKEENDEEDDNEKDEDEEVNSKDLSNESVLSDESDEEGRHKKKKKPKRKLKKAKDINKKQLELKKEALGLNDDEALGEESMEEDEEEAEYENESENGNKIYSEKRKGENKRKSNKNKYSDNASEDFIDKGDQEQKSMEIEEEIPKQTTNIYYQEYISEEDKKIIDADYPERLLLRYNEDELKNLANELKKEHEWICEQLDKSYIESVSKKKKIFSLLEFHKKDFLDIPYIVTYKTHIYEPELKKREVYDIFELDKEYQKLNELKQKVLENFLQIEKYLNVKIFRNMKEKYIDNAKSLQALKDIQEFINFTKEKVQAEENMRHSEEIKKSPENFKMQGPLKRSMISTCMSGNLHKLMEEFCLSSNDIAYNIELIKNNENINKLLSPPEPQKSLSELLAEYINDIFNDEIKVMENVSKLIGLEMINHPYIKEFVYDYLRKNCYVSTVPTKEGEKILDVFHPSFRTKRIKDRPILCFDDDLFLDVLQNEENKLIEVKIEINEKEDSASQFKYIFKQAINSTNNNINIEQNGPENFGIKRENNFMGIGIPSSLTGIQSQNASNKSDWSNLRESVIKVFFELITKKFIEDIRKENKEKAENFVINECSDKFYQMLMAGPYKRDPNDITNSNYKKDSNKNKEKNNNNKNNDESDQNEEKEDEEEKSFNPSDIIFKNDELSPKVMVFIFDSNKNETHCIALNQNGEVEDEHTFNFVFQRLNRRKASGNKSLEIEEVLNPEQVKCQKLIQKHKPHLIVIGANDLKSRFVKEQLSTIIYHKSTRDILPSIPWVTFGDLSIPTIYSNSQISEQDFPSYDMYIKQGISLGRYQQNPMQEILQLWKDDLNENYCLKIKFHPLQKKVDQSKLMEKMEIRAIEAVNACGFDLNKAYSFQHLRNSLQFISGFGPRKAKNFINQMLIHGKPKSRKQILQESCFKIFPKLSQSFLSFIKIKTDVTDNNIIMEEYYYDLLDMTRVLCEDYDFVKTMLCPPAEENNNGKKNKKKKSNQDKITDFNSELKEIMRNPKKLENFDFNAYIKQQTEKQNKKNDPQYESNLNFKINFIVEELSNPFKDPRKERKDLDARKIFYLLIGDENFKQGVITVAKVTRITSDHVHCHLENGLNATLWYRDIFEESELNKENPQKLREKMKEMFKPGYTFEARVKDIDFNGYKPDLIVTPSKMESHKNYIPDTEKLAQFFQLTDEDRKNIPYINSHSQQNRKYQPRNIKYGKFKNISYTDCCNHLKNKEPGECIFRPSSSGINHLTLSFKFYRQIICHMDIIEEDKLPGETIGKKLRISSEVYGGLDEIYKRFVIPCSQLTKDAIKNRKFVHSETKTDFENKLKDDKQKNPKIINYNFTILKDYPGFIVLGYIPKASIYYEYIRVKPRGLFFHDDYYQSLDDICTFFKQEYGNERYRQYVRTAQAPNVQYHKNVEGSNNKRKDFDYMSEGGLGLREDNYNSIDGNSIHGGAIINNNRPETRACHNCGKIGHLSKNCPMKNNDRNERNNNQGGGNNFRGDKDRERGGDRRGGGNDRIGRDKFTGGKRNRDFDKRDRDGGGYRRDRGFDRGNNNGNRQHSTFEFKGENNNNDNWGNNNNNNDENWGNSDNNVKEEKQGNDDNWGNNDNNNEGGW